MNLNPARLSLMAALLPLCILSRPVQRACFLSGGAVRAFRSMVGGREAPCPVPFSRARDKLSRPMVVSTFVREKKDSSRSEEGSRHHARVSTGEVKS